MDDNVLDVSKVTFLDKVLNGISELTYRILQLYVRIRYGKDEV